MHSLRLTFAISLGVASGAAFAGSGLPSLQSKALASTSASFVENKGQWDAQALYLSRTPGLNLWITQQGPVFDFNRFVPTSSGPTSKFQPRTGTMIGQVVRMSFVDAHPTSVSGLNQQPGKYNFFIGSDQSRWASNANGYAVARAEQLYKGISVSYSIDQGTPRYDVIVAPGADPYQVGLKIEGADGVQVLANGNLQLKTSLGAIEERGLTAYQPTASGQTQVSCRMVLDGDVVRFDLGSYDTSKSLVIDPLVASTFLGGTGGSDTPIAVVLDASKNLYLGGSASSLNFPTTSGAYQKTQKATFLPSAFVTKMNPSETTLIYSTLIGGTSPTQAYSIALDKNLDVYVAGFTDANDYPTTKGAFQTVDPDGASQASSGFVTKLNPTGSALLYSTFLGGSGESGGFGDVVGAIAVDASGDAYVTGSTYSPNFPVTTSAFQKTDPEIANGNYTGFFAKLNPLGTGLIYGSYLGGKGGGLFKGESGNCIAVDSLGDAYIGGATYSTNFPVTTSAYQKKNAAAANAGDNAFIAKVNPTGTALDFCTYLGGSTADVILGLALDSTNNVVVVGQTKSTDFPVTSGAFMAWDPETLSTTTTPVCAFVAKLAANGSTLQYSTYLGGSGGFDSALAVVLDSANDAYVVGQTSSGDFPTTPGAFQTVAEDSEPAFICKLNPTGTGLLYGTFLGGDGQVGGTSDECEGVALSGANVVAVGGTDSQSFPITNGAFNTLGASGFITTLYLPAASPTIAAFAISSASLFGGQQATGTISLSTSATTVSTFKLATTGPATLPAEVIIPVGGTLASFVIRTEGVNVATTLTVTATEGAVTAKASTVVKPAGVSAFDLNQTQIIGGHPVSADVLLGALAGSPATEVALSSSSAEAVVSTPLTIPYNTSSGRTTIQTKPVSVNTIVTLIAAIGASKVQTKLILEAARVVAVSVPVSCIGGQTVVGKVTLTGPAGPTGNVITLTSSSADATPPKTVTVLAGATTASFNITTKAVTTNVAALITASFPGSSKSGTILLEK